MNDNTSTVISSQLESLKTQIANLEKAINALGRSLAIKAKEASKSPEEVRQMCETCRWFSGEDVEGRGVCCLASSDGGMPDHPESPMYAMDYDMYIAWLRVASTHSCAAWEDRRRI